MDIKVKTQYPIKVDLSFDTPQELVGFWLFHSCMSKSDIMKKAGNILKFEAENIEYDNIDVTCKLEKIIETISENEGMKILDWVHYIVDGTK